MYSIKRLTWLLALVCFSPLLHAQELPDVPGPAALQTKEDYGTHAHLMAPAANWLEQTPLNERASDRQRLNGFVMAWVSGSPTVTVSIGRPLMKLVEKNEQLLALYLARYCQYYIEKGDAATQPEASRAGVESMIRVYQRGIAVKKNKDMEKLIRMREDEQAYNLYLHTAFL